MLVPASFFSFNDALYSSRLVFLGPGVNFAISDK